MKPLNDKTIAVIIERFMAGEGIVELAFDYVAPMADIEIVIRSALNDRPEPTEEW